MFNSPINNVGNYQNYSRNTAGLTSPSSNRYGNGNFFGNTSPRNPRLTEGINRTKSMRAVDTPGRGVGRTSTRNGGQVGAGLGGGRYGERDNNRMFKSNVHGTGGGLNYHSPTKDPNMNKSHTFFGRNNNNNMNTSFVGGTNNMNKSFAFGNRRQERNTTAAGTSFNELARMKRSHGPMGGRPAGGNDNISAFREGRATSMTGRKAPITDQKLGATGITQTTAPKSKSMRNVRNTNPSNPPPQQQQPQVQQAPPQQAQPAQQPASDNRFGSAIPMEPPKNITLDGPPEGFDPNKVEYPWNPLKESRMDNHSYIEAPVTPAHGARDMPLRSTEVTYDPNGTAHGTFQTDSFNLKKSQSPNGTNPTIYQSSQNQPFIDKIVKRIYLHNLKGKTLPYALGGTGGGPSNNFISNHKVDYKDFGTYVDDCKKHLMMADDIRNTKIQQNIQPVASFDVQIERCNLFYLFIK